MPKNNYDTAIPVRVTQQKKDEILKAAKNKELCLSDYIRDSIDEKLERDAHE